jgi:hypothetical protein
MYYKSRKLTFSPVKPIGRSPEKNNKYLKNQYIAPVILEEPPPDISKTGLQDQVQSIIIHIYKVYIYIYIYIFLSKVNIYDTSIIFTLHKFIFE